MSYEPRSRGMRSRRLSTKKPASKEKRTGEEYEFSYKEPVSVNPQELTSRVMNSLEHLGSQRFGMPPYSEHFRRWIVDVESVLNDFKALFPESSGADYANAITEILSAVRSELDNRIGAEESLSAKATDLQTQLTENERQVTELESEQRTKIHETKRNSDKSMRRLRGEINALDAHRLRLLQQKPTFLERILGNAKVRVETSSRSLHSKRADLENKEENLKQNMNTLRVTYREKRRPLEEREAELRRQLADVRTNTVDDAVDVRKAACERLRQLVSDAASTAEKPGKTDSIS